MFYWSAFQRVTLAAAMLLILWAMAYWAMGN